MELRRNIMLSLVLHATVAFFIIALVAGEVAPLRVTGKSLMVALMEETHITEPLLKRDKRESGGHTMSSRTNEPTAPLFQPEITKGKEEPAASVPAKSVPLIESEVRVEAPSSAGRDAEPAHDGYGHSAPSTDAMYVSLPDSSKGSVKESSGSDASVINVIRAAIERAKAYPVFARERRQEGIVVAEFLINGKGQPEGIKIVRSSGFDLLDSAARNTIIRAAPFPVIKGNIEVPIRFILDAGQFERR